jgi:hypothetical protein
VPARPDHDGAAGGPKPRAGRAGPERAPPVALAGLQRFLAAALRGETPIPEDAALAEAAREHVAGNDRLAPAEQADIYRGQFWMRHFDALAEDYPGLRALVGEAVFEAFVHAYLVAHPPCTPSLRDLGADIVSFSERWDGFPPEGRGAALEMLRYEQCFIDLFDCAEPPPLDAAKLQALPEEAWASARIVLHPFLGRLRLEHPMHLYRLAAVAAAAAGGDSHPPPPPARSPVSLVLYRRDLTIQYDEVEPEALALLDALAAGEPLAAACDRVAATLAPAAAEALGAKVGPWFQAWTAKRWIVDVAV